MNYKSIPVQTTVYEYTRTCISSRRLTVSNLYITLVYEQYGLLIILLKLELFKLIHL